eukprot:1685076-Amphidinium_carterae.1
MYTTTIQDTTEVFEQVNFKKKKATGESSPIQGYQAWYGVVSSWRCRSTPLVQGIEQVSRRWGLKGATFGILDVYSSCLLYTSDAADDTPC